MVGDSNTNTITNKNPVNNTPQPDTIQKVPKRNEEDFQKAEPKDPDLRELITKLTKTVMELVEENKIRKQQ